MNAPLPLPADLKLEAIEDLRVIGDKLAWVLCGGDVSSSSRVSEDYLHELEKEAFMSLAGEVKTQERMAHLLKTGKPLRN